MAKGYFSDSVQEETLDTEGLREVEHTDPDIHVEADGMSEGMAAYFQRMEEDLQRIYDLAEACRAQGLDPELTVEIPRAEDLAARVEKLVGPEDVAPRIRELSEEVGREEVALQVAREVAAGEFGGFDNKEQAVEQAVRTGLAILTEGILVAPLEGIAGVRLEKNDDGSDCVAVSFAGPIRAAGGTGQALSVLIADVVRQELDIGRYKARESEVARFKEEIPEYKKLVSLQYTPTAEEIDLIARNIPILVDGEGTEREEVGGNRDLERIPSNSVRGGACLVMAEGLTLKAPKIQKHVRKLELDGWSFIDEFVKKQKGKSEGPAAATSGEAGGAAGEDDGPTPIEENWKYVQELVAGRPVFGHPSRKGAFRLRYGRARTGGLASTAIHPAAMVLSDDFLAVGTQMKMERPGKATIATPCDTIEGPILLLRNGDLVQVNDTDEAEEIRPQVAQIVDLGELLVPFGEFAENNKVLPRSPYVEEWWRMEAERAGVPADDLDPATPTEAFHLAEAHDLPLHPRFNLFWHDLTLDEVTELSRLVAEQGRVRGSTLHLPKTDEGKRLLVELGALHTEREGVLKLDPRYGLALARCLGCEPTDDGGLERVRTPHEADPAPTTTGSSTLGVPRSEVLELVSHLAGVEVRPRATYRIGTRMGRPEKAAERKMSPPVHGLFPLGHAGGPQRLVTDAADASRGNDNGTIPVEVGLRRCPNCRKRTVANRCPHCVEEGHGAEPEAGAGAGEPKTGVAEGEGRARGDGEGRGARTGAEPEAGAGAGEGRGARTGADVHTEPEDARPDVEEIPLHEVLDTAVENLGLKRLPDTIKGVQGLLSRTKTPEPLEKALLRAKHDVYTFKDGTVRFDMTDVTLTHFRPREVHATVDQLRELGYTHDVHGDPLESPEQTLELKVQDLVVSRSCMDYLLRTANYVDELLVRFYGYKPFYNADRIEDLVGEYLVGLAPHTSGGVLGRVIGWTKALGGYAHPYFHAAKRRNCDGDEDVVMLLLDGLLNFSRSYLPSTRGGLMDAPLTLSTRIDPSEIDGEAHNVDVGWSYPLEFFEATVEHPKPKDVEDLLEMVDHRLGDPSQYEGFGFTHDTQDVAAGPPASAYKTIGDMMTKMEAQLQLGVKLRGVDAPDVAARVIGSHFLPDLIGNLKAFSKQKVRCTKCNAKFRRIPVQGRCLKCETPTLTMTVHEGSVTKYLEVSKEVCEKYDVNPYVRQRIEHIEDSIHSLFQNDKVTKAKLSDFF